MKLSEILDDRKKWVKCAYSVDAKGGAAQTHSDAACRFCLLGAMERSWGQSPYANKDTLDNWFGFCNLVMTQVAELFPDRVVPNKMETSTLAAIAYFNDHPETTFEDIQTVIQAAEIKRYGN